MKASTGKLSPLQWLRSRETAMTQLLGEFVRTESPSLEKAAVDRFGKIVAREWRRRGAEVTILPQRERGDHIRAEWNPRGNRAKGQLLVLGHPVFLTPNRRRTSSWRSDGFRRAICEQMTEVLESMRIPLGGPFHRGKGLSPDAPECFQKQRV